MSERASVRIAPKMSFIGLRGGVDLQRPGSITTRGLKFRSVIPAPWIGFGEFRSPGISPMREGSVPSGLRNSVPFPTVAQRERMQASQTKKLPQTRAFSVSPLEQITGDTTGKQMTRAELGTLLEKKPFDGMARKVEETSTTERNAATIVELPKRRVETSYITTQKPLIPGGRAPQEKAETPAGSNAIAEVRMRLHREVAKNEFLRNRNTAQDTSINASNSVNNTEAEVASVKTPHFKHEQKTSGAKYMTLLKEKVSQVERNHSVLTDVSVNTTAQESSPVERAGISVIPMYSYNRLSGHWDIVTPLFVRDPKNWEEVRRAIRRAIKVAGEQLSLGLPTAPDLESILKDKKRKRVSVFAEPSLRPQTKSLVDQDQLSETQPQTVLDTTTQSQIVSQIVSQERTVSPVGTTVTTGRAIGELDPLKSKDPRLGSIITVFSIHLVQTLGEKLFKFYEPAQNARVKQWREAVARFFRVIKPAEFAPVHEIVGVLEAPTRQTTSPLATMYGIDDGSDQRWREHLLYNQEVVTRGQADQEGTAEILGLKPVYLHKTGLDVDTKDVAIVLSGKEVKNRKELELAA